MARWEALELPALAGVDLTSPEPVEETRGVLAGDGDGMMGLSI